MDRASRPLLAFVRRSVNPQVRASFSHGRCLLAIWSAANTA